MARFLLSPGTLVREVDASQYPSTTAGIGNSVALIGYAEKGPFDPVIVSTVQDFETTFGKTLTESPYLAMTASKLFAEGQQVMVVRAGSDRDPEASPSAAQFASKTIRITPKATEIASTAGYQEFNLTDNFIAQGTFTPGMTYKFGLIADHMAFKTAKIVEKWAGKVYETYNGIGGSVHSVLSNVVAKISYDTANDNSFEVDYKAFHETAQSLGEYSGTGTRTGTDPTATVVANVVRYRTNDNYGVVDTDTLKMKFSYNAVALGNVDITAGGDFSKTSKDLGITVGSAVVTLTLDAAYADADALVDALKSKIAATNLAGKVEVMKFSTDQSVFNILFVKTCDDVGGLIIATGAGATALGLQSTTYPDNKFLYGTWTATAPITGPTDIKEFSGVAILQNLSSSIGVESFEDKVDISLTAPSSGNWSKSDMLAQITSSLGSAYASSKGGAARAGVTLSNSKLRLTAVGINTEKTESIVRISAPATGTSFLPLAGGVVASIDGVDGKSYGESILTVTATEKGSYGNKLSLKVESGSRKIDMTTSVPVNNVYVYYDGLEVSSYIGVFWGDGQAKDNAGNVLGVAAEEVSPNYILTRLAADKWVTIQAEDENGNSTMGRLPVGTWALGDGSLPDGVLAEDAEVVSFKAGTNGWESTNGVITSMSADFIKGLEKIQNPEVFQFNLVAAPGAADANVQNAVQALCESRRDCFGVIDAAPFGIGLGVKNATLHISEVNKACGTLSSSYVGAYWPWLQDYDATNKQYVWLPPSTYALTQMIYTDNVSDPWFAPAGTRRGKISAISVEYSPTNADRDILYGDGNIVNPIVQFVNEGIVIWGQKTAQRTQSATDRVNVRRLMIYAEKLIASMARGFLFEPNDPANWAAFARQANAIMEPIRQRRGVYQYTVICDATTNTPDLTNQNIMAGKIFLQPTKTIEFLEISFTIDATTGVVATTTKG